MALSCETRRYDIKSMNIRFGMERYIARKSERTKNKIKIKMVFAGNTF